MRLIILLTGALLIAWPALAGEPSGCDKFAWPLAAEQHLLAEPEAAPHSIGMWARP